MTLGDRIKHIRKNLGLTQADFGKRIGVSGATISTSESGKTNPDEQTIRAICSEFSINRDWLVDGIGEMAAARPFVPELLKILQQHPALKAVMEGLIDRMTPEDWDNLNDMAARLAEEKQKKDG